MPARIAVLLAVALVLGSLANAVSPRGLSWKEPLGQGLRARVEAAGFTAIGAAELLATKSAVIVDARPHEEYKIGRIKGAISLPWRDIDAGKPGTPPPKDKPIIVYCANEFCQDSLRLAQWLDGQGYKDIAVYVEGWDEWWNGKKGDYDQD